jgi:hypothetical protein
MLVAIKGAEALCDRRLSYGAEAIAQPAPLLDHTPRAVRGCRASGGLTLMAAEPDSFSRVSSPTRRGTARRRQQSCTLKSPDGAARRFRTANLTGSECPVIVPGMSHSTALLCEGGRP